MDDLKLIDPHVHMSSRTTDDYEAMAAAGVVAEAMTALVLADVVLEKFGGDSVAETRRNLQSYLDAIPGTLRTSAESDDSLLDAAVLTGDGSH